MEIRTVLIRTDGIKYCIIPKKSKIKAGEKVLITNNLSILNKLTEVEKIEKKTS
jgi:hypothetical protein